MALHISNRFFVLDIQPALPRALHLGEPLCWTQRRPFGLTARLVKWSIDIDVAHGRAVNGWRRHDRQADAGGTDASDVDRKRETAAPRP